MPVVLIGADRSPVEVHAHGIAEHRLAPPARSGGGLPVRFAVETASGPVSDRSSSAMVLSGIRSATVPWVSPRSHSRLSRAGRIDREPARPERRHERAHLVGHLCGERVEGRDAGDQHGRRGLPGAALRVEQPLHRVRVEGVGRNAVDGVGGQDDEFPSAECRSGQAHAGQELGAVRAVVNGRHVGSHPILRRRRCSRRSPKLRVIVDLYLFDFDKTLYRYDFRKRLPALAGGNGGEPVSSREKLVGGRV